MAKIAEVALGPNRLVVEMKHLTWDNIEKLAEGYSKVKLQESIFGLYPMNDDETYEQWSERVAPQIDLEGQQKEGESYKDFVVRVFDLKLMKKNTVFETLKIVASLTGQEGKVSEEAFRASAYPECKEFLSTIFNKCDIPVKDFD